MFRVKIDAISVRIRGCPESGLEAVEFSRDHGIEPAPHNRFEVKIDITSEELVTKYRQYANDEADIRVENTWSYNFRNKPWTLLVGPADEDAFPDVKPRHGERHTLDPEIVAAVSQRRDGWEDTVLSALHLAAEAERRRIAPLIEEARRKRDQKEAEEERKEAERKAVEEANLKKAEEAERIEEAGRAGWIEAHGSKRLKRMLAEGIECFAAYFDERMALERPGWVQYRGVPGETNDPRNPPDSAFDLLDEARKTAPDAVLQWYTVEHEHENGCDCYGDCPTNDVEAYVAEATFIGRAILFGVPKD